MMIGFGIPISFITLAFGTLCFVFFNFYPVMNTISTIDSKSDNAALAQKTLYSVLFSIAFAHLINDLMQSVIPAAYPILKENFSLNFTQIGLITFVYQLTASLLQPFIGFYTDKTEALFLAIGMVFTISGLALLSIATQFWMILVAVSLVGIGSSIFHPEASRVAFRFWRERGLAHLSVGW
jgi:FSR family fosmidomycin resistance protein-like MFS transporter